MIMTGYNRNVGMINEYRTKFGMTKVVLRGSWGCHCCKTDRAPKQYIMINDYNHDK